MADLVSDVAEEINVAEDLFKNYKNPFIKDLKSKDVDLRFKGLPPQALEKDCVLAKTFPYMNFGFEYFNPMQSQFLTELEHDHNVVVCARTSAGKTVIAETMISQILGKIRERFPTATAAYIAPLKALCKEKEEDWTNANHPFSQCKLSILTGDYILTTGRKNELQEADIVVMSSEMLGSRVRLRKAEGTNFLHNIRALIVDESHLIAVPERGPNLESALVKFTAMNPDCRIIFLSATMPNVDELGAWLTHLNKKPTTVLKSDYRPVELKWNWDTYKGSGLYAKNELAKRELAVDTIKKYKDDKFLLFVHSKKQGRKLQEELAGVGIMAEFYNADLNRGTRLQLEKAFKDRQKGSLRILITTSAMAWGVNTPARRVFILGIHRGMNKVMPLDIIQMGGRAGRVGIDTAGDVHVAISDLKRTEEILHCQTVENINSQINSIDILGFHLVSEINEGTVVDIESAVKWFERTLANYQNVFVSKDNTREFVKNTIANLEKWGAIEILSDNSYKIKVIGKVSSWYYLSPFDVAMWVSNFKYALKDSQPTKAVLAWALANIPSIRNDFPLKDINREMCYNTFKKDLPGDLRITPVCEKYALAYYSMLIGRDPKMPELYGMVSTCRMDMERKLSAIHVLNSLSGSFTNLPGFNKFLELPYLLKYGISSTAVELVMLPGIGTENAKKLVNVHKIYTARDLIASVRMGRKPLPQSLLEKVIPVAEDIANLGKSVWLKKRHKIK